MNIKWCFWWAKRSLEKLGGKSYTFTFHVCRNQCSAVKLQLTTEVGSFKQGFIDEWQMFDKSLKVAGKCAKSDFAKAKDRVGMPPTWVRLTQGILQWLFWKKFLCKKRYFGRKVSFNQFFFFFQNQSDFVDEAKWDFL